MNIIEIEDRNGFFLACQVKEYGPEILLFVTGGRVGDFPSASRVEAAVEAERFREKHPGIQDIKFKSMQCT